MVFAVGNAVHQVYLPPPFKNAATWPFDQDQYLFLYKALEPTNFPSLTQGAMKAEWVRKYQESPTRANEVAQGPIINIFQYQVNYITFIKSPEATLRSNVLTSLIARRDNENGSDASSINIS